MEIGSHSEMCSWIEEKANDRTIVLHVKKWALGGVGMTENEAKAIKWMKNIKDHAVVTLDHIKNVGICLIIRSSF